MLASERGGQSRREFLGALLSGETGIGHRNGYELLALHRNPESNVRCGKMLQPVWSIMSKSAQRAVRLMGRIAAIKNEPRGNPGEALRVEPTASSASLEHPPQGKTR